MNAHMHCLTLKVNSGMLTNVCVFLVSCSYCYAVYRSFGRSDDEPRGPATCFLFTLLYTITSQLTHCVCLQYKSVYSDLQPCYVEALSTGANSIMLI